MAIREAPSSDTPASELRTFLLDDPKVTDLDIDQDQLWSSIETQLHKPRQGHHVYWLLPLLASAVAVLLVFYGGFYNSLTPSYDGVKSASNYSTSPMVRSITLNFAVLDGSKQVRRGFDGMSIALGESLVFTLRGDLPHENDLTVSILATHSQGYREVVVHNFTVSGGQGYVEDQNGFVTFTPPSQGSYKFSVTTPHDGQSYSFRGFSINVLP
ncbi:MAG: hypothetical protein HRU19_01460 [Pseudobacteriovorax sp.]|nr:hypothetical protein [Pseudobacteriovorax sp.]